MTLFEGIFSQAAWLQIWVVWLMLVNSASVFFVRRREARWVLGAWLVNALLMTVLAEVNGFNRLLGLSHVLVWTPLLVYLALRWSGFSGASLYDKWLRVLFASNLLSLIVDYLDVVRYLFGDRS